MNNSNKNINDICFVYTNTNPQGRLGAHAFDVLLPPLGLAYLAAVTEKAGYSSFIIDGFAENINDDELFSRIDGRFRYIGFYCHTQNYESIKNLSAKLKKTDPSIVIIIGGPHPTASPEESLSNCDNIDYAVFGEGEETLLELITVIEKGEKPENVKGVLYRDSSNTVVKNDHRELIEDLDTIPMPAWHLLPVKKYQSLIEAKGKRIIHVMGSRGCYNDCNYCFSSKIWEKRVRWHSRERLLAEIDHLRKNHGIKFFQFFDDNFTLKRNRLKLLMDDFRKRKLDWCCSTRIDLINEEILTYLRRGKIDHVCIGIESISDKLLGKIGKNITSEQTKKTIKLCHDKKVRVLGMFIVGIPGETREETLETIHFSLTPGIYFAVFSCMTFYPGTNFYHMYETSPYVSRDFTKYDLSKEFSFIDENRTIEELEGLMSYAYLKFYFRIRPILLISKIFITNPKYIFSAMISLFIVLKTLINGFLSNIKEVSKKEQTDAAQ